MGRRVLVIIATSLTVACGSSGVNTAPASPSGASAPVSAKADGGASESFGEVNPADLAELQGGASKADAPKSSEGPETVAASAADPGPVDDCSPVARDFERRVRPKIKECYREGKKKEPDLKGTIKIGFEIDGLGKARPPKVTESTLPKGVTACMLKAVKGTTLPEASKCPNKNVLIPVMFPTPP